VILDNASLHHAKYIKRLTEKYPCVKLFFPPPYSPEYNPAEQFWKWAKPLVHAAKTINGGLKELLGRFRKLMHARTHNRLVSPMKIGIGVWKFIYR
jgi:transposase